MRFSRNVDGTAGKSRSLPEIGVLSRILIRFPRNFRNFTKLVQKIFWKFANLASGALRMQLQFSFMDGALPPSQPKSRKRGETPVAGYPTGGSPGFSWISCMNSSISVAYEAASYLTCLHNMITYDWISPNFDMFHTNRLPECVIRAVHAPNTCLQNLFSGRRSSHSGICLCRSRKTTYLVSSEIFDVATELRLRRFDGCFSKRPVTIFGLREPVPMMQLANRACVFENCSKMNIFAHPLISE